MNRYTCAVCLIELKSPEKINPGSKYVCEKCFPVVTAAERLRDERRLRKLQAWEKRQPKP